MMTTKMSKMTTRTKTSPTITSTITTLLKKTTKLSTSDDPNKKYGHTDYVTITTPRKTMRMKTGRPTTVR